MKTQIYQSKQTKDRSLQVAIAFVMTIVIIALIASIIIPSTY